MYTDPYPGYVFGTSNPAFSVVTQGTLNYVILTQENYLDYETTQQFQLQVFATEVNTAERRTGTITLTVNILDANDNSPVFPGKVYASSVSAGFYTPGNSVVITTVHATDADSGVFGQISYSITSVVNSNGVNATGLFNIDFQGQIRAVGTLVQGQKWTLTVMAADGGTRLNQRVATTAVIIDVNYSGNQPPAFPANSYSIAVSEGLPPTYSVFQAM
ncbi:hypothetical protein ACJMK2_035664, partial [Sinanodonta woodiana]